MQILASQYTDLRPEFFITKNASGKLFSAELTLPSCVDPRVRKSQSLYSWETERMARRDAALQAIVQLHKAKLLNDNLLPLAKLHEDDRTIDKRPSVAVVRGQVNPWKDISATWGAKPPGETDIYGTSILLEFPGHAPVEMELILPVKPETMEPFTLYWNDTISCKISSMPAQALPNKSKDEQLWRETTYSLLSSMFSTRMASGSIDFPILFIPSNLGPNLESWLAQNSGSQNAVDVFLTNPDTTSYGLVRDLRQNGVRHIFRSWSNMDRKMVEDCTWSSDKDELFLQASRLPKRTDFLHPIKNQGDTEILTNTTVLAAETCTIDKMPLRYSLFSALIPCITHRYENHLVAQQLAQTILAPVRFININLVCAAITASIASESMDYQKLEFIGDCILKTCTSIHIQVEYPTYHEGYLSLAKDRIVSNSKLARAATEIGLDQFILITPFTGLKWKPIYISNFSNLDCQKPRQLSTKVLADVVEALIGVAYLEGGLKKALDCLRVFIPEIEWKPLLWLTQCLYDMAPMLKTWPPNFAEIETLIDYQFTKKALLLEALTHPSSRDVGANGLSYQKLEFQGDSVLDYIVVSNIIKLRHNLSYQRMHLIRTALVNADFLAFLCTQLSTNREVVDIVENSCSHTFHEVPKISSVCLWQFMRHTSGDISQAQMAFLKRYEELCDSIASDLLSGSAYPWSSLCRLEADKYFSDIVESLIGGIYIDSRGDIAQCERMAEVIGILPYLRRLVTGDIHVLHPKEEIGHIADTKTVNYLTAPYEVKGGNCVRWSCTLKIGDVDIVTVSDGTSAKEVNTRAAHESVKIMRARAA
ncbi:MAG: hypothetical protein M1829_006663 [Trizodia sp. TS-e1964]|nr:MAG: hypothetical protein M1829_006663 [Trizodia sp. TS-e1964]